MTQKTQPAKARRAKAKPSAFMKSPMTKGIAIIGSSGLVIGLGITGSGSALASGAIACSFENTVTAVASSTVNRIAIQAKLANDGVEQTVCLSGNFVIDDEIEFVGTKHIKGVGESSSIKNPSEEDDIGGSTNSVFVADPTNSINVITIENLTIKETAGYAVFAHEIVVTDTTFSENEQASIVGYSVTATNSTFIGNASGGPDGSAILALVDVDVTGSTFTGNTDGTIVSEGSVNVTGSTFTENTGGTIFAEGSVNVTGSTFTENSSLAGGAIYSELDELSAVIVSNSTFSGNFAPNGGAISAIGVSVENSTFENNIAIGISEEESNFGGLGGAIKAATVVAVNSTFVGNMADGPGSEGGAIFAEQGGVVFSTFLNNEASVPVVDQDVPGNAIYKAGGLDFSVSANIFAGTSLYPQLGVGVFEEASDKFDDLGGNVFSTSDLTEVDITQDPEDIYSMFGVDFIELFGTDTPLLATYAPNSYGTQTIALAAGSPAIGFVPSFIEAEDEIFDQRGAKRLHPYDAGAFQFAVAPTIDGPTGGTYVPPADFTVLTFPTGVTNPGADVKVSGLNLTLVKEVFVSGVKVKIQAQRPRSITFTTPRGLTGAVDVRFVSAKGEYTAVKALNFGPSVVAGANAQTVVGGFAANSTRLSVKMKREIRAFLKANPGLDTVVCTGFTSLPATVRDAALSKARGQVTCDFVKKITPDITVKVMQGRHTERPGSQIRRVRITLQ